MATTTTDIGATLPGERVALPPRLYIDDSLMPAEQELIFERTWQLVGHVSALPRTGSYLTGAAGNQPVLVVRDEQVALARRIEELAAAHPRFGYRRIWALLDREGWAINKKAVRRLYRESGLKVARPRANPKPRREHGQDKNACHLRPSRGKDDVWT